MLSTCLKAGARCVTGLIFLLGWLTGPTSTLALALPAVVLAWDPSTDPTVTGYNVYYGTASHAYTNVISAGATNSIVVSNLTSGVTYYFAAPTYNLAGLEIDYS